MKKLLSILMVCALMLGLFACASTNEDTTTTETTAAPTEQPTEPVVDDDAPAYAASFHPAIFRYGMTKRIVKDCRVGRTRPPRNDKLDGFCGRTEQFQVLRENGAISGTKRLKNDAEQRRLRFSEGEIFLRGRPACFRH